MNKFSKTIIVILIATFLLIIMCYISNKKESSYSTQINQELYEDNLVDTICENIKKDSLGESKEKDLDEYFRKPHVNIRKSYVLIMTSTPNGGIDFEEIKRFSHYVKDFAVKNNLSYEEADSLLYERECKRRYNNLHHLDSYSDLEYENQILKDTVQELEKKQDY